MKALCFSVSVPQFIALKAMGSLGRRFYYTGPWPTVKLENVPEPVLPGPDWLLLKTSMCGFCASDLNLIFLRDSPSASPFTSFPAIMGHELWGTVEAVGAQARRVSAGDRVAVAPHLNCATRDIHPVCPACASGRFGNCENMAEGNLSPGMFNGICNSVGGGFAQYMVVHESQVFPLPSRLSPEAAVMLEPLSVALQAVLDNLPGDDDQVLVIGGGVIGSLIVKSIRGLGISCRIAVSEPDDFAAEQARSAGADHVIQDGDLFGQTVRITGARRYKPMLGSDIVMGGFTKVFDTVGNSATLNTAMRCTAVEGVVSVVGIGHDVKLDLTPLWLKLQTIRGVFAYGMTEFEGEMRHVFEVAIELVQRGCIETQSMVTHRFALDQYRQMIETNLEKGKHGAIKTVVAF